MSDRYRIQTVFQECMQQIKTDKNNSKLKKTYQNPDLADQVRTLDLNSKLDTLSHRPSLVSHKRNERVQSAV